MSEFKNGAFEQTLNGSIFRFPIPGKSNTANPSAAASTSDTDAGRSSSSSANKTKETAARTGVNLSDEAAQKARANFAKTDPRRLDTGDGGKRAILGAQGAYKEATFATNAGGAAFGNPSITRQGITAGATVLPAGEPRPPTDGTGRSLSPGGDGGAGNTAQAVGEVPPKLSGRPVTPGSLRARQIEATVARLNAQAGDPNSVTNPANQQVNKGDQ